MLQQYDCWEMAARLHEDCMKIEWRLSEEFIKVTHRQTQAKPQNKTALSEHIWELKEEDKNYSISWHIIEKSQAFDPVTLQCKLCLSEVVNILLNPTAASLNKKSEALHHCRHRKKYLLAYTKRLALKGGALTYRYKRWVNLSKFYCLLCLKSFSYY